MFDVWQIIVTAAVAFALGWAWARYREPSIRERLTHCETSLSIWDNTRSSEYWLRYGKR